MRELRVGLEKSTSDVESETVNTMGESTEYFSLPAG